LEEPIVAVHDSPHAGFEKDCVHMQELGPVVVEATSLDVANVAEQERAGRGTDHAVDPVLWEDAQDSLPGADPEGIVPQTVVLPRQEVGSTELLEGGGVSELSPSVSSVGPTELSLSADLDEAGASENVVVAQGGEYICISLTGGADSEQDAVSWRQEVTDSSSAATGEEKPGSPTQSFTGPNSQMQMIPGSI
jgi:hypothetical protein